MRHDGLVYPLPLPPTRVRLDVVVVVRNMGVTQFLAVGQIASIAPGRGSSSIMSPAIWSPLVKMSFNRNRVDAILPRGN